MSISPPATLGSSSPCKGEDRWGSAARGASLASGERFAPDKIIEGAAHLDQRPAATPTLTLPLSGGGNAVAEVDR
jgi:hypothetical protein